MFNRKLENELGLVSYDAMFKYMLKRNKFKIWVVEVADGNLWKFFYAREDARECARDRGGIVRRYGSSNVWDESKKIYVLVDTCNGGQGVYGNGYMFVFDTKYDALKFKKKVNDDDRKVDVIGPYNFQMIK